MSSDSIRSEVAPLVRILKRMERFKLGPPSNLVSATPDALKKQRILGVYENPGDRPENVVVTDEALWVLREDAAEIRYSDMKDATWWPKAKHEANALRITLLDGTSTQVPVRGRKERTADVFEFCRFAMRAIGRVHKHGSGV